MDNEQLLTQIEELKRRLADLAHENADLRVERDVAWAKVHALLPKATPEQEEEFRRQLDGEEWKDFSGVVEDVIADLRAGNG